TADGVVVVLHDTDFQRAAGDDRKIWDLTFDELRQIDVGSSFSPEFAGETVPTLQEAIDLVRGRAGLYIELKINPHEEDLPGRVVKIIRDNDFASQCLIMSLNRDAVAEVRHLMPELCVGLGVAVKLGDLSQLDADFVSAQARLVTLALIGDLRRHGKATHVWTVNDREQMATFTQMGVDYIITDHPSLLRAVVEEYRNLSKPERLLLAFRQVLVQH
ncbi:MAG: glycerophosphodiester phosphodiesterase, partial [Planctomycetota bacterium]